MYKYMSARVAVLFARTLQVRFSQPNQLNDPFELSPLIDFEGTAEELSAFIDDKISEAFGTVEGALAMVEKYQQSESNVPLPLSVSVIRVLIAEKPELGQRLMTEVRRHKAEILKTVRPAAVWEAKWEQFQKLLGQLFGILSLTEDSANTLMWSHYASSHTGIVVEFDQNADWFDKKRAAPDEFRHLVRVTYVQNPHPRTWRQLNGIDILYTKSAEWAYEREWRIIRPLKDGTEVSPGVVCFDVPPAAVQSIIFGCRTTPDTERDVRASIAANTHLSHVSFQRARMVGGKIEIQYLPY